MVKAKYTVKDTTHTLVLLGHANYAEHGKDIVCAGVSALVQALIGWIEETDQTVKCISIDEKEAEVIISCEGDEDVATAFNIACIGLGQIANSYPNHVHINIIGTAD